MAKSKITVGGQVPKSDTIKKVENGKIGKKKKQMKQKLKTAAASNGNSFITEKANVSSVTNPGGPSSITKQSHSKSHLGIETGVSSSQHKPPAKEAGSTPLPSKMGNNGSEIPEEKTPGKGRRKKASKKAHNGMSNWASMCAELKIDPTRKKKPPQITEEKKLQDDQVTKPKKSKPEVWFDNVDKILIERDPARDASSSSKEQDTSSKNLVKPDSYQGVTHCVAMDCEMVGVGPGGEESILARVSIVNHYGVCLYDKFVLPTERVTDYRTHVSGVTKENISTGEEFTKVQQEVSDIITGKILVGHALHNDMKVLFLAHPHKMIRDTSKYKPFRQLFKGGIPSLKKLADSVLGVSVQEGQHSSVQDAQATMRLYTMHRQRWEKELKQARKQVKRTQKKSAKSDKP